MGASESGLSLENIEQVQRSTNFTPKEIKKLFRRFQHLDKESSGFIGTDDFLSIPELAMNPLHKRIIKLFDENDDDKINFVQFCNVLSVFSPFCPREKKLKFAFKIYDINGDGYIDSKELYNVLYDMTERYWEETTDLQINQLVEQIIREADKDKDNKISFEEFSDVMKDIDLNEKMSIKFS